MNKNTITHLLENNEKTVELCTHFLKELTDFEFDKLVSDHLVQPDSWDEGDYTTYDGQKLRHTFSSCANPKALLVVLQGRAQSAHEYYEFTKRAHDQGYAVFTFDRRSQGNSQKHFTDGRTDHHIPDIMLQVGDVADIMEHIVKQSDYKDLPRAIIGHSMGGAEAAHHLKFAKDDFKAAVYLAPMFAIHLHQTRVMHHALNYLSPLIFKAVATLGSLENLAFGFKPWSMKLEAEKFSDRKSNSPIGKAIQPALSSLGIAPQVGSPTWGTAKECLCMTQIIQRNGFFDDIKTPSLCLLAQQDNASDTNVMAPMMAKAGIETHIMPGRHQTLNEIPEIKNDAYDRVFNFLNMHL
jgi:lysophospholipase